MKNGVGNPHRRPPMDPSNRISQLSITPTVERQTPPDEFANVLGNTLSVAASVGASIAGAGGCPGVSASHGPPLTTTPRRTFAGEFYRRISQAGSSWLHRLRAFLDPPGPPLGASLS